ncbi:MAG: helix-turn-helix transcriptional regulator [Erysipelotrichaceae bacterium]|nr:helix-turn-helix transcriptional regulator [Erysipelotrichaceae bacterium]
MDRDLLVYLGGRVREIRLEKDMTQQDLSNRTGVAPYYISRIENGRLNIRVDMLFKLAKGLGVDVTEIVKDK